MLYASELAELMSQWMARVNDTSFPDPYRDALRDCTYELKTLVNKSIEDELSARAIIENLEQKTSDNESTGESTNKGN